MKSKVIYMLTTVFYPSIGGRESHIHNISKELVNRGYEVKIIHAVIGEETHHVTMLDGIEVHTVGIGDKADIERYENYKKKSKGIMGYISGYLRKNYYNRFYKNIIKYIQNDIKSHNYKKEDIMIHQHDFISGYRLSKTLGKSYHQIFTNHTGEFLFLKKLPFNKIAIKRLTKHFDYIISPSEELNQFDGIRPKESFCYMPNGVDTNVFAPMSQEKIVALRKQYNIEQDQLVILCPRRWAPTKGIIYLVKAVDELVNRHNIRDFQVIFVGDGYEDYPEYKESIEVVIRDAQIEKYVKRLGNLPYEDMSNVTGACDVVVIPSLMEAVSLSMLESMASGKIVVGSDTGGIPEVIEDGENGFLAVKGNEKDLALKLKYIIEHNTELERIRVNALKTVEKSYTWKVITDQVEEIYLRIWRESHE